MERKTVNFEKDDCLHTKINACIVLQKTVRGYLTRLKLAEAKEIYDSIFFETENGGDGFQPSGVPATTVDGTMFRKTGCYLGQQETESFSDRARLYSTKVQKRARVRAARTPTTRHHGYSIPNVPRDWPRARIQRCSHGREVRKAVSPTTESQFPSTTATTLAQLPGETSRSTLTESCVQTSGLAGPVVVDASVQTVSEAAVQTDPPPMTSHPVELLEGMQGSSSGSISSAGTGSTLSAGTGSTTSAGTGSTTSAGTDILPSESGENVAEDSLLRNSSQPQRPASVASTSTDDILEFTAVTPLPTHNKSESSLPAANQSEASESFQAGHKHSSTPLSTPSNKHNQQLTSDSKVRQLPTEETSLWTQATLPPSNINSDATESELRAMKENMSMELMWIEQAIASRKQYLSLKKSMADDKQPTES